MTNRRRELTLPRCNEALQLRASSERERVVERSRLSLLGMLLACVASGGNAPRP